MRTLMINTIDEDYVGVAHAKGLRDRRVMTRYAGRNAILPALNGFAAQFATAVGGVVVIEFVFSYPGRRPHAAAGRARRRLPAGAGAARRPLAVRDRRELHHGPPQLRPRPARADQLMRRLHLPGWARLLAAATRSPACGVGILLFMIVIAVIAPLISVPDPNAFSLDAHQAPSWHHLFGTTDQGSDVFSQVVVGHAAVAPARRGGRRARDARRRDARDHRRLLGRHRRRGHQLPDQRLPRHPADPAPRRHLRLPEEPRA